MLSNSSASDHVVEKREEGEEREFLRRNLLKYIASLTPIIDYPNVSIKICEEEELVSKFKIYSVSLSCGILIVSLHLFYL